MLWWTGPGGFTYPPEYISILFIAVGIAQHLMCFLFCWALTPRNMLFHKRSKLPLLFETVLGLLFENVLQLLFEHNLKNDIFCLHNSQTKVSGHLGTSYFELAPKFPESARNLWHKSSSTCAGTKLVEAFWFKIRPFVQLFLVSAKILIDVHQSRVKQSQ